MNRRMRTFLALALIAGALFSLPAAARAAAEPGADGPPTVRAWIDGNLLRVDAVGTAIDAVYIDGSRVAYRVDGAFAVTVSDFAGNGAYLSVYAMDAAGRVSNVVQLPNPCYVRPAPKPSRKPNPPVASPSASPGADPLPQPEPARSAAPGDPQPLTPDGTGTTVDNVTERDGKEFFTVVTEDDNTFYLIVDRQRDDDNVYLLNAVTEDDLAALAKKDADPDETAVPTPAPIPQPPTPTPAPTPEPEPEKPDGLNAGAILLVVLAALGAGGAAYYLKIVRPKQLAQAMDEDDGEDAETDRPYDTYDEAGLEDTSAEE